jgi:hypothetical protein
MYSITNNLDENQISVHEKYEAKGVDDCKTLCKHVTDRVSVLGRRVCS